MVDLWDLTGQRGYLNIYFSRNLSDWELQNVEHFFVGLQGKLMNGEEEDRAVWMDLKNETFLVKFFYALLELTSSISFLGII